MKKSISILIAVAALAAVSVAQADAECQRTNTCSTPLTPDQGGDANGHYDPRVAEQYGLVPPGTAQAYYDRAYSALYGVPAIIADGRWGQPYGYASPYPRTSRDRDGDGVRNNRDRYPDDPRYR